MCARDELVLEPDVQYLHITLLETLQQLGSGERLHAFVILEIVADGLSDLCDIALADAG